MSTESIEAAGGGETSKPGPDKSWDRAGYVLGFRVYNAIVIGDESMTEGTLCAILKKDGDGDAWYDIRAIACRPYDYV